jgi:hypothetical protein
MYLMQALIFCAVVGSNIKWHGTPNQYLASGIGVGCGVLFTDVKEMFLQMKDYS